MGKAHFFVLALENYNKILFLNTMYEIVRKNVVILQNN